MRSKKVDLVTVLGAVSGGLDFGHFSLIFMIFTNFDEYFEDFWRGGPNFREGGSNFRVEIFLIFGRNSSLFEVFYMNGGNELKRSEMRGRGDVWVFVQEGSEG